MALNFTAVPLPPKPCGTTPFLNPKHKFKLCQSPPSSLRTAAQYEGTEGGVTEDPPTYSGSLSSTRTQLDLLEQLTSISSSVDGYASDGSSRKLTIRDQLAQLVGDRDDDFSIPLGKNLKKKSLPSTAVTEAVQKFQFLSAAARWLNCWFGIGWELRSIVVEIDVHCRWFVY